MPPPISHYPLTTYTPPTVDFVTLSLNSDHITHTHTHNTLLVNTRLGLASKRAQPVFHLSTRKCFYKVSIVPCLGMRLVYDLLRLSNLISHWP